MKILLIEDDVLIQYVVRRGLEKHQQYRVEVAADGQTGLRMALEAEYALILLDVMLPGMDGWRICEELRARRIRTPILMLTARDAVSDRVYGLELGADDYLPKPFDFSELVARIRALLRREQPYKAQVMRIADLTIDTATRRVVRGDAEIHLSPREYTLLVALARNVGHVLSREVIQYRVWNDDTSTSNTAEVYIGMLRKKVDAGYPMKLIQTVYGEGYMLITPATEAS
ncbi:MAG: response regulator transcription factor [Armatimonadota bacterium]